MEAEMDKNKFVGISKVGEKGQIVIPKEARDMFDIKPGDSVVVLCDKNGNSKSRKFRTCDRKIYSERR